MTNRKEWDIAADNAREASWAQLLAARLLGRRIFGADERGLMTGTWWRGDLYLLKYDLMRWT